METVLGVSFTASVNPLVMNQVGFDSPFIQHAELRNDGAKQLVNRGNREQYVDMFVQHALHNCCVETIEMFCSGLRMIMEKNCEKLFTAEEVSVSVHWSEMYLTSTFLVGTCYMWFTGHW